MKYLLFIALLLSSCSNEIQKNDSINLDALKNTEWKLVEMNGDNLSGLNNPPTIIFTGENNKVTGKGGCNSYGAEVIINDGSIKFSNIFSTKMFCEDRMDIEQNYFNTLEKADNIKMENERLYLAVDKMDVLVYDRVE